MPGDLSPDLDDLLATADDGQVLVRAAARLATDLLAPAAAEVDAGAVPRSHLDAIGAAGLLGLAAPHPIGAGVSAAVSRRVTEILAGADLATWFVQVQHHAPVRALAAAAPRFDPALRDLTAGRRVAGIAFSHVRHWPRRPVTATAVPGGRRLDGVAPWYTGWGLNDLALVAGVGEDGEVVFALLPARPAPGLRASAPLDVAALRAARTVTLTFDGLVVPAEDVVSVEPVQDWLAADAVTTANVNPAVFGVAESAIRLLAAEGERRGEPAAVAAARRLANLVRAVRAEAYHLLDDVAPAERVDDRLRLRARAHQVLVEATTALVVAGAGPSMSAAAAPQRKAREALFLLVQAQTTASRTANLEAIGRDALSGA